MKRPGSLPSLELMTTTTASTATHSVHANGIDIHYRETGQGTPLVLLHGGLASSSDLWAPTPVGYASFMDRLGQQFRVIAPDARTAGRTRHPGGPVSASLLADDVAALIEQLGLDRPIVAGFSEGGLTALLLPIRHPSSARGVVCDAGFDTLNPDAAAFTMLRMMLGEAADPSDVDPDAVESAFSQDPHMAQVFALMKADVDAGQGAGSWRNYVRLTIERWSHWPGYGYADLASIAVPTLLLVGDRDDFCTIEEAAVAYRNLRDGQLAVLPGTPHVITQDKIEAMVAYAKSLGW